MNIDEKLVRYWINEEESIIEGLAKVTNTQTQSPNSNYQFQTTNFKFPISNYQFQIPNFKFPISNYQFQITYIPIFNSQFHIPKVLMYVLL